MWFSSLSQRAAPWLLAAALVGSSGLAMAQAEPTLNQIYATAQAGKLDQAQVMVQQVLISHPNSAKAHFVRAELYARQGDLVRARDSLATADKLSPGLGFAKPEAVQALRAQLSSTRAAPRASNGAALERSNTASDTGNSSAARANPAPVPASSSGSWGLPLLLAGAAIVAGYFIFRRQTPAPQAPAGYGPQGGLSGPQNFGMGGGATAAYPPGGAYGQQPAGSGMGGRILGGVATGLAVGAGVVAAEALARNLMGGHHGADAGSLNNNSGSGGGLHDNDYQTLSNSNPDMGGADFGINDGGSWDSGGGGGDWDN